MSKLHPSFVQVGLLLFVVSFWRLAKMKKTAKK